MPRRWMDPRVEPTNKGIRKYRGRRMLPIECPGDAREACSDVLSRDLQHLAGRDAIEVQDHAELAASPIDRRAGSIRFPERRCFEGIASGTREHIGVCGVVVFPGGDGEERHA